MKTFTEKRFFEWHDDEISVSLRYKSGSYGGGSEVFVLQRRFSDVRLANTDISPTLETGAGDGGNNLPMILLQNNQNNSMVYDGERAEISPTLPASMGMGGRICPNDTQRARFWRRADHITDNAHKHGIFWRQ